MTQTTTGTATATPALHIGGRCRFDNLDWFPVGSQGASPFGGQTIHPTGLRAQHPLFS